MLPLSSRMTPSHGPGIGRALIDAHLTGDTTVMPHIVDMFTLEEIISSVWETVVWVTAYTQGHGNMLRIGGIIHGARAELSGGTETGRNGTDARTWADEFVDAVETVLIEDLRKAGPPRNPVVRRPQIQRPVFTSWVVVDAGVIEAHLDGARGRFEAIVAGVSEQLVEGVIAGATAVVLGCSQLVGVPAELILSVVDATTLSRAARGDFARC